MCPWVWVREKNRVKCDGIYDRENRGLVKESQKTLVCLSLSFSSVLSAGGSLVAPFSMSTASSHAPLAL